jgi:hypothetical protein
MKNSIEPVVPGESPLGHQPLMRRAGPLLLLAAAIATILGLSYGVGRGDAHSRGSRAPTRERSPVASLTPDLLHPDPTETRQDDELRRGSRMVTITGTVKREDGTPIQGATVRAMQSEVETSIVTGPDGSFAFKPLPIGDFSLDASASGRASVFKRISPEDPNAKVDFVLANAAPLFGRILDQRGNAVSGVGLRAWSASNRSTRLRNAESNDQGKFQFTDARVGTWWLELIPPREGQWASGRTVLVSPEQSPLEFRLRREQMGEINLRIDVVDADSNQPIEIEDATLRRIEALGPSYKVPLEVQSGVIRASALRAGEWMLRFRASLGKISRRIRITDGESLVRRKIKVGARGSIKGRAVLLSASELPQRLLLTSRPPKIGNWVVGTGANERKIAGGMALLDRKQAYSFRMAGVPSGLPVWLVVQGPYLYGRKRVVVRPGRQEHIEIRVRPSGGLSIRLSVELQVRPIRFSCWPDGEPDWTESRYLRDGQKGEGFPVPAGFVQWRVEYPARLSGELVVIEGRSKVSQGESVVVEPELK